MALVVLTLVSLYFMVLDATAGEFLLLKTIDVVREDITTSETSWHYSIKRDILK